MLDRKDIDGRRTAAETEFYEHTDKNGVVRRTSLIKTLEKDDTLIVRGANPRTGMVTPTDTISIASSVEDGKKLKRARARPSTKWKLQGDQWISISQEEPEDKMRNKRCSKAYRSVSENISSSIPHDRVIVKSLTAENLVALAKTSGSCRQVVEHPHDQSGLFLPRIRRKPVGSPPKVQTEISKPARIRDRIRSDDTIVRKPPRIEQSHDATHHSTWSEYFSPDDVGRNVELEKGSADQDHSSGLQPFLGTPVKSQKLKMVRTRDFTVEKEVYDPFSQGLQMRGGPYPSNLSRNPQHIFHTRRDQNRIDNLRRGPPQWHQEYRSRDRHPVPTVSRPRGVMLPIHRPYYQGQGFKNSPTQDTRDGSLNFGGLKGTEEDHRLLDWIQESQSIQKPNLVNMKTGTNTIMSSEQEDRGYQTDCRLISSGKNDYSAPITTELDKQPNIREPRPHQETSIGGINFESHANTRETANETNLQKGIKEVTTMAPENPSKSTGTAYQSSRIAISAPEKPNVINTTECSRDIHTNPSASDQSLLAERRLIRYQAVTAVKINESSVTDHSKCCSECCLESDCHESCLGHSSLNTVTDKSDASSFTSSGIFDDTFQTSIAAVNEALLTDWKDKDSKLTKVKNAFVEGWRYGLGMTPKTPRSDDSLKKTLRSPPNRQKYDPMCKQPKRPRTVSQKDGKAGTAKIAAQLAMYDDTVPTSGSSTGGLAKVRFRTTAQTPQKPKPKPPRAPGKLATNSMKVSDTAHEDTKVGSITNSSQAVPSLPEQFVLDSGYIEANHTDMNTTSVKDAKTTLDAPRFDLQDINRRFKVIERAQSAGRRAHEMSLAVVETAFTFARIVSKYSDQGMLVLPDGVKATDFMADCVRSILYLMIAACVYALMLRLARVIWLFVKILFLPVRVYTWIAG